MKNTEYYDVAIGAIEILLSIVIGNWGLFAATITFGMLINVITNSSATEALNSQIYKKIPSRFVFILCVVASVLLFSSHDYLCALTVSGIFIGSASHFGISNTRLGVTVNMLVASAVTLFPSTWQPVLKEAIFEGGAETVNWKVLCFFPVVSLCLVLFYAVFAKKSTIAPAQTNADKKYSLAEILAVFLSAGVLIASFVLFSILGYENAILWSACVSFVFTSCYYLKFRLIGKEDYTKNCKKGFKEMANILTILCSIFWFSKLMIAYLHLDQVVVDVINDCRVPLWALPFLYFVVAAAYGFITSSTFASFKLVLPLAAATVAIAGVDHTFLGLIIAASVSGCLFASEAFAADSILLITGQVKGEEKEEAVKESILHLELKYTGATLVICGLAYAACGYLTAAVSLTVGLASALLIILIGTILTSILLANVDEKDKDAK